MTPTTSVTDIGTTDTSIVYPNPSTGEVRIRCSSPTPPERWGLTSINGQAIASGALTPNEAHPIDGSYMVHIGTDVPKGTYLLTLYGEQGTVVCTQNVVRQ
jgi:hypothetical protein